MSKLVVYGAQGSPEGEIEIPDGLLVLDRGEQAVHEAVVAYRAGIRAGTASTLTKGGVCGSNKKPWRQKGTGQARSGYRRSPIWRGGGVVFGPHPRSYAKKIPRKARQLAFCRVLSEKITDGSVKVVERLDLPEAKTKLLLGLLKALEIKGAVLIVLDKPDERFILASRNLPEVEVAMADAVGTYQVLKYPVLLVTKPAVEQLTRRMASAAGDNP